LEKACKQLHIWQEQRAIVEDDLPLSINVNISGKQFIRPEIVDEIKDILKKNYINPTSLSLEITENSFVDNNELFQDVLEKIRKIGINIYIDDYGRGQSSFSCLQRYPVNKIKIDSFYIRWMDSDIKNSEIIRTILNLAKSLDMSVVAEGVETHKQLKNLKNMNCPSVQGFLLSKPLDWIAASELLSKNRKMYNPD
jgi:EAL domain-containing protein (putative c-di-GMP-specific phosphodiesterase class I)